MLKNKIELNKNFIILSESIYVVNYLNGKIFKYSIKGNKYEVEKNYNFSAEDFDVDVNGYIWAIKSFCGEYIIYKLKGDIFTYQNHISSDRSLLSVYDDKNIIISDKSEYSLISNNRIIAQCGELMHNIDLLCISSFFIVELYLINKVKVGINYDEKIVIIADV